MSDGTQPYSGFGPDPRFLAQDRRRGVLRGEELQIELPDVGSGAPVFARTTHTWAGNYTPGGMVITPPFPSVPSQQAVFFNPKNGYTFQIGPAADHVTAWIAGAEEIAGTAMGGVGAVGVLIVGKRPTIVPLVGVPESWRVAQVQLVVGSLLVFSATNFWTVRLQALRASGETDELGSLSTAAQTLAAGVRYDLLAALGPAGAAGLKPDDALQVRFEETGQAPAMIQPTVIVRRRRF